MTDDEKRVAAKFVEFVRSNPVVIAKNVMEYSEKMDSSECFLSALEELGEVNDLGFSAAGYFEKDPQSPRDMNVLWVMSLFRLMAPLAVIKGKKGFAAVLGLMTGWLYQSGEHDFAAIVINHKGENYRFWIPKDNHRDWNGDDVHYQKGYGMKKARA
jgi:hypothetical protein